MLDTAPRADGLTTDTLVTLGDAPAGVLLEFAEVPPRGVHAVKLVRGGGITGRDRPGETTLMLPNGDSATRSNTTRMRVASDTLVRDLVGGILRTCREQHMTVDDFLSDPGGYLDYWGTLTTDHAHAYAAIEYLVNTVTP
jgi:hypothetical protein